MLHCHISSLEHKFSYPQLAGFLIYTAGVFLYNDVIIMPFLRYLGWVNDALPEDTEPVLPPSGRLVHAPGKNDQGLYSDLKMNCNC